MILLEPHKDVSAFLSKVQGLRIGDAQVETGAMRLSDQLKAGTLWMNTWGDTDAASPFGGMKQSGYGREMSEEAIVRYSQTKSVWIG